MATVPEPAKPHQFTIEAYGVLIQVYASTAEIMERIEALIPPKAKRVPRNENARRLGIVLEADGTCSVYSNTTRVSEGTSLELALVVLDGQIRSWIAVYAPDLIFIHAGAVEHDGRAIVIPGQSFSGKTTLVAALVKQGATYLSDEYAVIDQQGLVHPYLKPLSIRPAGTTGEQVDHTVEALGGTAGDRAVPLGLGIITYFVPDAEWNPRRLSPGEAALALMARTVPARYRPQEAMQVLARAVEGAVVLEGERGEADDFAEMLLSGAVA